MTTGEGSGHFLEQSLIVGLFHHHILRPLPSILQEQFDSKLISNHFFNFVIIL